MSRSKQRSLTDPGTPPVRLPEAYEGVQVNCCRDPNCTHFGQADPEGLPVQNRYRAEQTGGKALRYSLRDVRPSVGKGTATFRCTGCGEGLPIKSNRAIYEEYVRLADRPRMQDCCTDPECSHHGVSAAVHPKSYRKFGYTAHLNNRRPRLQCKECLKVFVPQPPRVPGVPQGDFQMAPEDALMLKLLVGKMPLRRILDTIEMNPFVFYRRLARFAGAFQSLARTHEAHLPEVLAGQALRIGVDRQEYFLNWRDRNDRRNPRLLAVASADNASGYVFGHHLNFDPLADAGKIEAGAAQAGDFLLSEPYRHYARYWLPPDYQKAALRAAHRSAPAGPAGAGARASVRQRYLEALQRADIEAAEAPEAGRPDTGMQVHSSYTLYGHFLYLQRLLGPACEVAFYLDQDSGMRAACLGIWSEAIRNERMHAFYVRYNKHLTIDQKKARSQRARRDFANELCNTSGSGHYALLRKRMLEALESSTPKGPWRDRWARHPYTSLFEPEKEMALLTPFPPELPQKEVADRHLAVSLHAVSRYFMQVRRMLSLFERPIRSGIAAGPVYGGYAPYSPRVAQQVLQVFRGYYNYCKAGEDGATPAMRVGLAERPYTVQEVLGVDGTPFPVPAQGLQPLAMQDSEAEGECPPAEESPEEPEAEESSEGPEDPEASSGPMLGM